MNRGVLRRWRWMVLPVAALFLVPSGTAAASEDASSPIGPYAKARLNAIQLVLLHPAGTKPDPGLMKDISATGRVVDEWFADQMKGRSPRFVTDSQGVPSVVSIRSPLKAVPLSAQRDEVGRSAGSWYRRGLIPRNAIPVVIIDNPFPTAGGCGWYDKAPLPHITIPIANCLTWPTSDMGFPYGASYLLAHELTHALGAVDDRAPNSDGTGHVRGNPRDLLYQGRQPRDWANLMLDPGNDDYYLTGRRGPRDINTSPLLEDPRPGEWPRPSQTPQAEPTADPTVEPMPEPFPSPDSDQVDP